MSEYLKVDSDSSLVRDMDSHAIVNNNRSEFNKFLSLSEKKYIEKRELENLKSDVNAMKGDLEEIKSLLKSIVQNWFINICKTNFNVLIMAAYVSNIVIDVGADFNQTFNLEGSNNAPLDLTGYTGVSRMKKHAASLNTTATFAVSFPNRAQGQVKIALSNTVTKALKPGRYGYDLLLKDGSNLITRVVEGSAIVTAGITTTF